MLRQQLQETKETLAARDAEVGELKTRVAELEKLQQQQQQLLTMKDSALASAQQTLAKSNQKAAAPVTPKAQPVQSTGAVQPAPAPPATPAWLWGGGVALLVAALLGWLLTRRRRSAAPDPRRSFDVEALAASMPGAAADRPSQAATAIPEAASIADQAVASGPTEPLRQASTASEPVAPPWHGGTTVGLYPEPAVDGSHLLGQAQSCLDRGDEEAAKVLLREVLDGRDPAARATAARLLRDL